MRHAFFLLLFLLPTFGLFAQSPSPQVINSAGASAKLGTMYLEYSVGESVITTLSTPKGILTQGFLQPEETVITRIREEEMPAAAFRLYPNPVRDRLYIETAEPQHYRVQLLSFTGARVWEGSLAKDPILFSELAKGVYCILLNDTRSFSTQSFKVVKY